MNIILYINIVCTGIVLSCSVILVLFGNKILSTIFNGIFWFFVFLYLFEITLRHAGILKLVIRHQIINMYIPVFYALFLMIKGHNEKVKFYFAFIFLIPLPFFIFDTPNFIVLLYHLIAWSFLIFLAAYFKIRSSEPDKKAAALNIIQGVLIILAVFPFIIFNLVLSLIYKKNFIIEEILPPCLAATSLLMLYFSYKLSLIKLNHDFYANIDMLKKSITSEKKTIIEKITTSLVHEIKNPITAIQSLNGQLLSGFKNMKDEKIEEYLKVISEELFRTKSITEEFLKIYKKQNNNEKKLINLGEAIDSLKTLLAFELEKKNILLKSDESLHDVSILFNSYNLKQLLLNLIYNSMEADAKNIEICIKESAAELYLYIKDDGCGIDDKIADKIFNQFFSTKAEGVGMGLVIIREILHDSGGDIKLASGKKNNTVFELRFQKNLKTGEAK